MNGLAPTLAALALLASLAGAPGAAHGQSKSRCLGVVFENPSAGRPLCSKSFNFTGTCNGRDMQPQWTIANFGGWKVKPWENQNIDIVSIDIVDASASPHTFWMVGNAHAPDPMAWLGPNEWHSTTRTPSGTSWPFPASSIALPGDYIDLHGYCSSGKADLWMTFTYVPEGLPAIPPNKVQLEANAFTDTHGAAVSTIRNQSLQPGAGPNGALVVALAIATQSVHAKSCSWGNQPLSLIVAANSPDAASGRAELWGLTNPAPGNNLLACDLAGETAAYMNATAFTGVDQRSGTASFRNSAIGRGTSASAAVSVATAAGDMAIDAVAAGTVIDAPTQNQLYLDNSGGERMSGGSSTAQGGSGPVAFAWRLPTAAFWVDVGVSLKAASSPEGDGPAAAEPRR